jgi:hypothetical protein
MFETMEEPGYLVPIENDAAVGVLQSKEWFDWDNESKPLEDGTSLIFCIQSQVSFKDKTSYHDVADNIFCSVMVPPRVFSHLWQMRATLLLTLPSLMPHLPTNHIPKSLVTLIVFMDDFP